jgi:hypothetical protein
MSFLKIEILDVTLGEKQKNRGKRKKAMKNWYFTKIEPYLYEFVTNVSSFGIYTCKTKEILFEI